MAQPLGSGCLEVAFTASMRLGGPLGRSQRPRAPPSNAKENEQPDRDGRSGQASSTNAVLDVLFRGEPVVQLVVWGEGALLG